MTRGTLADAPVARYSNHGCNQCRTSGTGGITTGSRVLGYLAIGHDRAGAIPSVVGHHTKI